jgi:glycosyltransferase involved in cell wall biosynthesis
MDCKDQQPFVSCIMPTYNRREFIPSAIKYFLRQDYDNKELIIIDDGTDAVGDLIPEAKNIRYYRLDAKISLGAKLNLGCQYANGKIIVNWDDDDWVCG